jgi:conjugal transfer pilus assembly protein TraU
MNFFKALLVLAALYAGTSPTPAQAQEQTPTIGAATCLGKWFNPVTDTDWNNMFPITIAGVPFTTGGNSNPPLMAAMPPICTCPTIIGIPWVGIGITFWQPMYVAEIERRPGCLSSMGGISTLAGYSLLASNQSVSDSNNTGDAANRMQVHWYEYPIASMLEMLENLQCKNTNGFNLAYMTEIDSLWQDDLWGGVFSPESSLFASPLAHAACAVDAVASSLDYPLDALFWCAGAWGNVYPLTGNSSHSGDPYTLNNQIQAKFIARNHRTGLAWQTIGPSAICGSHPNPIWVKSQYRYDQVGPINRRGRAVVTGSNGKLFQFPPVTHVPTQEHTINLIWQGQQCCAKGIP